MKHKNYTCDCCGNEVKNARPVSFYIICNTCQGELIRNDSLELPNSILLQISNEPKESNDTVKVQAFRIIRKTKEEQNAEFWASRKRCRDHAAMSNWPTDNYDTHASY